eukprot:1479808-Amphidinium_carterae.1
MGHSHLPPPNRGAGNLALYRAGSTSCFHCRLPSKVGAACARVAADTYEPSPSDSHTCHDFPNKNQNIYTSVQRWDKSCNVIGADCSK